MIVFRLFWRRILPLVILLVVVVPLTVYQVAAQDGPQNGTPVDFVGSIDTLNEDSIVVSGVTVNLDNIQQLSTPLQIGMIVHVQGTQVDGVVMAQNITPMNSAPAVPPMDEGGAVHGAPNPVTTIPGYALSFTRQGNNLIVANNGTNPLNPALLRLENKWGTTAVANVATLQTGQCLVFVRGDRDFSNTGQLNCNLAREPLTYPEEQTIWRDSFGVYYEDRLVGFCEADQCNIGFIAPTFGAEMVGYVLLVGIDGNRNLTVFNLTARNFPLTALVLGNQAGQIVGSTWGVHELPNGRCVLALSGEGRDADELAGGLCNDKNEVVGNPVLAERFWRRPFAVYYLGQIVGFCDTELCTLSFAIPSSTLLSPDRTVPPPNSRMLTNGVGLTDGALMPPGDMQIEGYCARQGYAIGRDEANWYCLNAEGVRVVTLGIPDFDAICQMTYSNPNAFAIRMGTSPTPAFNWKCYGY